jgi:putative redox protein
VIVTVKSVDASGYAQVASAGGFDVLVDEPRTAGGQDTGPRPTELLLASLGACTSITLRMYADRKGWALGTIEVAVALLPAGDVVRIERRIAFGAPLTLEQRTRLKEISEKTPVTRMLGAGVGIDTVIAEDR